MKRFLLLFVLSCLSTNIFAEVLEPEQNYRSSILYNEAVRFCKKKGMRLPTARELAMIAKKYGAEILEIDETSPNPEGFRYIKATDPNGKIDEFYFGRADYTRYRDVVFFEHKWWSSSEKTEHRTYIAGASSYLFDPSQYPAFEEVSKGFHYGAFCVKL